MHDTRKDGKRHLERHLAPHDPIGRGLDNDFVARAQFYNGALRLGTGKSDRGVICYLRGGLAYRYHGTFSSRLFTAHTNRPKATGAAQLAKLARVLSVNPGTVQEDRRSLEKRSPLVM